MRLALINPPNKDLKNTVKDLLYGCWCQGRRIGGGSFPPLNLLFIGTLLEKEHFVKIIDPQVYKLKDFDLIRYLGKFQIIILPTTSFCYREDVKFLGKIKDINPSVITIIFGSFPTFYLEQTVKSEYVDFAIAGEPEFTIRNLVNRLQSENKQALQSIKGICYTDNEKIVNNGKAPTIENLDLVPIPNRSYIRDVYYFNPLVRNKDWTTALSSRGCPAQCNYCLSPEFYGNQYRFQTPKRMLEEVQYLINTGYKEIFYRDETFTGNKRRIEEFCNLIKEKKIEFDWICNIRIGSVNYNLLSLMKSSGCHYVKVGVESGSQLILNNLNKNISLTETKKVFKWMNQLGLSSHAHLILGSPGETKTTIYKTIEFVKKLKPSTVTFNLFTPFPGTKIFREYITQNNHSIDETSLVFDKALISPYLNKYYNTDLEQEYLLKLIPMAYRKFYLRFKYFLSQIKEIKSLFSLKKIVRSGFNVILFMYKNNED